MKYKWHVLGFLASVFVTYSLVVFQMNKVQKTELSSEVSADSDAVISGERSLSVKDSTYFWFSLYSLSRLL